MDWATSGPSSRHGHDGSPVQPRAASQGPPTDSTPTPDATHREGSRGGRAWSHIQDKAVRSSGGSSSVEKRSARAARPSPPPPPPPRARPPRRPKRHAQTSTKKSAAEPRWTWRRSFERFVQLRRTFSPQMDTDKHRYRERCGDVIPENVPNPSVPRGTIPQGLLICVYLCPSVVKFPWV